MFLAGTRAWKLKRAVRYDYLDFSSAERRKPLCEAEVRLNRRTAPGLYRGVVAIVRTPDGALALGGAGVPVDWVVEMNRFDQDALLDRLAGRDALDLALMAPLATAIAELHLAGTRRTDHGGAAGMAWVVDGNAAGFEEQGKGILDADLAAELTQDSRSALDRHAGRLDRRREAGFVRQCHGDLHLRNIVLIDGRPTLFDAIEFNDEIACTDVLYDLAFLLMDLWRRRLPRHANVVLNRYLAETLDFDALPLLPLFLSCRSAVRAKTSATSARLQTDPRRRGELEEIARGYLALAATLLRSGPASLIAIGGFSGSGKSTLAHALAPSIGPVPGALVMRSDEIRKRLCGVDPLTRLDSTGYTTEVTRRVYEIVAERAGDDRSRRALRDRRRRVRTTCGSPGNRARCGGGRGAVPWALARRARAGSRGSLAASSSGPVRRRSRSRAVADSGRRGRHRLAPHPGISAAGRSAARRLERDRHAVEASGRAHRPRGLGASENHEDSGSRQVAPSRSSDARRVGLTVAPRRDASD